MKYWNRRITLLKKTNRESGATFMEVLVTMAIIAILMTTVGLLVVPFIGNAQINTAKQNINTFRSALAQYYVTNFDYPDDTEWQTAIEPLLDGNKVPLDPWENDYIYMKPGPNGEDYSISSWGPDGIEGNEDDINSWD
jgi:general secretion pathway protein G